MADAGPAAFVSATRECNDSTHCDRDPRRDFWLACCSCRGAGQSLPLGCMDKAALAAGVDPVEFRRRMLDGAGRNAGSSLNSVDGEHRQAAVLAIMAGRWVGVGIATTFGQERAMPHLAGLRRSGAMVIDAGTIIHPDSAQAQSEGASCGVGNRPA